jgi:hypothetical protein
MRAGRWALVLTCLLVAGLGAWFTLARWEDANRMATVASALGAVAAVGVAVWAALRGPAGAGGSRIARVRVSGTGDAKAGSGGRANTGLHARGDIGSARVENTGRAEATGGGDANTGVES